MQKIFIKISQKIEKKAIYQHLLFAVATFITICFLGYYFGTFDQASHIPFLKKNVDSSLYPKDVFFTLCSSHYSFFWFLFKAFYQNGSLEIFMFITHILTTYFTYLTIWKLSKTIFNSPLTSFLSVIAFILPHIGFAGFSLFEFSLLNRTFVLPFLLLAINYYLKKRYAFSYLILGLMYNFHVVSVNFIAAMFLFDGVLRLKKVGLKNLFFGLFFFFLTAAPIFIWKSSNSGFDLTINQAWYELIKNSILNNIFSMTDFNPPLILLTLNGLASIIIFFLTKKFLQNSNQKIISNFIFAGIIILIIQAVTSKFFPITILIQAQIIRVGVFLLFFAYLFFCHFISFSVEHKKINNNQFLLLFVSLLLSILPLLLILVFFAYQTKKIIKPFFVLIVALSIIIFTILLKINLWRPGIHIYPNRLKGYQIQNWAKKNTPKQAVFITPPHLWWFYSLDWRVISERTTVVTLSELLEAAFEPKYANYWQERFEDVAPGALKQFKGNIYDNLTITKKAYYSLTKENIKKIAKKYQASYLVIEKPYCYRFPIIYEDNEFRLYKID